LVAGVLGWTPFGTAMTAFVGDPHQFGQLGMASLAGAQLFRRRLSRVLLSALSVAAIILSSRRGVWIAGAVEIGVICFAGAGSSRQRVAVAVAVAAVLGVLVFAFQQSLTPELRLNPNSFALREQTWETGLTLIKAFPLVGGGWSATLPVDGAIVPYNLWINVAASLGIPAAILLTVFFASLAQRLTGSATKLGTAALAYLLGFLALSIAEMTFYASAPGTITFFILMGAALSEISTDAPVSDVKPHLGADGLEEQGVHVRGSRSMA
jgi:hypothetical protein